MDWLGSTASLPPVAESKSKLWRLADAWDYSQTIDRPVFDDDRAKAGLAEAHKIAESDPEDAHRRVVVLAETGSVPAMEIAAWLSREGIGAARSQNEAEGWLRRAAEGGSRYAQLYYAQTLAARGDVEGVEAVLANAVSEGWRPHFFGWGSTG
jgi:TPR repeat protein